MKQFGKNTFWLCLLNPIPGHIAEGYQGEENVNSVLQIVGGHQQKNKTETLAWAKNNLNNLELNSLLESHRTKQH